MTRAGDPVEVPSGAGLPGAGLPGALVLDLVAAVLQAGLPPVTALDAVGRALQEAGDPRGTVLRVGAAEVAAGGPVEVDDPAVAELLDGLDLAVRAGAAPTPLVRRAADRQRRAQAHAQQAALRRLEIWMVAPAGLCWLPAFVLVGVVPLVVDLMR